MSVLATLPLAYSGFALIGLSMDRHARQAGHPRRWARARPAGWGLIAFSLAGALLSVNWRFALVEWVGVVAAAAGLVVLTLFYRPQWLPRAAGAAALLGVIGWFAV